jgi:DNA-binding LacI/PurR family transcriptional regulator
VLSNSARVRPETRERVEQAMRELLYVSRGRLPLAGATGAIGLLMPEFQNPVFASLAQALETRATGAGFATIICNTAGSAMREVDYVHMLLERRVDAMVFVCSEVTDVRGEHGHYRQLLEQGARLVFVNGGSESLPVTSVGVDERAAGRLATEHLIGLGHRRVGFVAGGQFAQATREKALGRADALGEAGLPAERWIAHASFTVDGGRHAIRALLEASNGDRPTGVICSNDLMAIGALQEAGDLGVRVPDELSIVGFDGIDATLWTRPALTTVEQPIDEIAETTVTALESLMRAPDTMLPRYVFRPRLRAGGTTAAPQRA